MNVSIYRLLSSSPHIFILWFLVDGYHKTKISAVNFSKFTFCQLWKWISYWSINKKILSLNWFWRVEEKSKQTRRLIFCSFGTYLPKTKRQKYEMNKTCVSKLHIRYFCGNSKSDKNGALLFLASQWKLNMYKLELNHLKKPD